MELLIKVADDRVDDVLELLEKLDFVEVETAPLKPVAQAGSKTFLTVDVDGTNYRFNREELNER